MSKDPSGLEGTGRTRLGRFAAVTLPATIASVGLGFAIVQGMVSASLSAADPFTLASSGATADSLGLSMGSVETATAVGDSEETATHAARVNLTGGELDDMCLVAAHQIPILGQVVSLRLTSSAPVSVGNLTLNAASLGAAEAILPGTDIGISADEDRIDGLPGAFGLRTDESDGGVSLTDLDASAYAIRLDNGIALQNMSISPQLGSQTCG